MVDKNTLLEKIQTHVGFDHIIISILFLANFIYVSVRSGVEPLFFALTQKPHMVLLSLVSVNLIWVFISRVTASVPLLRRIFFLILITFYNLLSGYHFGSKVRYDYSVMADNDSIIFNKEALDVVLQSVGYSAVIISAIVVVIILLVPFFRKKFDDSTKPASIKYPAGALFIYLLLFFTRLNAYDELSYFIRTVYFYYNGYNYTKVKNEFTKGSYPLVKKNSVDKQKPAEGKPHIFIVQVESFNSNVIFKKSEKGKEITPFINKLTKEGFYVKNFYGNSIQSCKGQFATLFSLIPSMKEKSFIRFHYVNFHSLPEILKINGYRTMFFKAYKNIQFDNTGNFVKKNGVDIAESIVPYLTEEDKKYTWGWGIEDRFFYKRFFEFIDKDRKENGERPIFALLHTVMNHMKFNHVPEEKRYIYPEPETYFENYANNIYLTDQHLKVFFSELEKRDYLKNSIVIITGDHSMPLEEHGYNHNEISFYEEFFKTPFLLIWKGHIEPEVEENIAYSQLDIAPTLLHLTGIAQKAHHFQGVNMFEERSYQHPIYLIQPYNGIFLGSVRYPMKYIKHLRSDEEFVFNLKEDPMEENNLVDEISPEERKLFSDDVKTIFLNQYLLETDEVWSDKFLK